jgi:hypothetical protein
MPRMIDYPVLKFHPGLIYDKNIFVGRLFIDLINLRNYYIEYTLVRQKYVVLISFF